MSIRMGVVVFVLLCCMATSQAQSPTAVVNGQVRDSSGAAIPNASVVVINNATGIRATTETNSEGIYSVPNLAPGTYRIQVSKQGFKTIVHPDIILHVQDAEAIGFTLPVGATSETVTVEGGAPLINTESATVGTVVDRQFADNLPMNGRSFQTLINLTPGIVVTPIAKEGLDSGQFSVNGQRAASNYWTVDGVSANVGSSAVGGGNTAAGAVGTYSVLGGTNSLVSVDALQEFRIQTSTLAPEFGRTPGAQISIVTRSGTNNFHGSLFDYLRNDVLDANNWFNGVNIFNVTPLPKAEERQNDFGGTFSGPIVKDRTFFFFSYEGLRLRLPQTMLTTVPDSTARQSAVAAMQPFLNAYPLDTSQPDLGNGIARFNKSFSEPATLDAYSLRVDHRLKERLTIFGRYNYSPSEIRQRGFASGTLNSVFSSRITTQSGTLGATWTASTRVANELRVNYSRTDSSSRFLEDSFGGALPLSSLPFPSPFTAQNASFVLAVRSLTSGNLEEGTNVGNLQRQVNLVDNVSVQRGPHNLKFGVDYRRLSPVYAPLGYQQFAIFTNVSSAENGSLLFGLVSAKVGATLLFQNLGAYAQDTWRVVPRLTVTYGLRWDNDFAPSSINGPGLPAVTGFNLTDLSNLAIAPLGTPPFTTTYGNVAPRVGVAYQLSQKGNWGTVIRGGFGVFYDLATSEVGNIVLQTGYPFASLPSLKFGSFPLNPAPGPPSIQPPSVQSPGSIAALDPNLKLPYTLQWNVALEQALGKEQTISASYVGAVGRRLLQSFDVFSPSPSIKQALIAGNTATSDYHALQVQFKRQLSRGFQALASYTFSHSIDTASAGSTAVGANALASPMNVNANRGSSDFDIRHAFSTGVTYAIPSFRSNSLARAVIGGWSLQSVIQARSAAPLTVIDTNFNQLTNGFATDVRADVIPGIPLYLYGSQYPGGKALNNTPGAVAGGCPEDGSQSVGPFCPPPQDANMNPLRNGNSPRNGFRGFGLFQWDASVHRDFPIRESLKLQFRAEMFNVLNHPNFAPPITDISNTSQFGLSTQALGQSLGGGSLGSGGFSPLYQIGGPRSIQFALKLSF